MSAMPLPHLPPAVPRMPQELADSPAFLLGRLGALVKSRAIHEFETIGFSPYHYAVLAVLAEAARQTQAEIADTLKVDRSQLVGLLDSLEERGLVERRRDPNDRRRHTVSLTPDGKAQLGRLRAVVKRVADHLLAPLDAEGRQVPYQLLLRVACHTHTSF